MSMLTRGRSIRGRPHCFGYLHDFSSARAVSVDAAGHQSVINVELDPCLACSRFSRGYPG
jgi:hypothetical protein